MESIDHQTLIGAVGPEGYSGHTFSSPRAGTATIQLAWTSSAGGSLDLYILRPRDPSSRPPDHPVVAFSNRSTGTRQEVSFGVGARESFEVLIDSHASRTQAYVITMSVL